MTIVILKRNVQMMPNFDMTSSAHNTVSRLSLASSTCLFLILLRHMLLKTCRKNRVRRLCITMVIKLHSVLAIPTICIIFLTGLIKYMFRLIVIYAILKSNHAFRSYSKSLRYFGSSLVGTCIKQFSVTT